MDVVSFVEQIEFETQVERIKAKLSELSYGEIQVLYKEHNCDHIMVLARKIYHEYKEKAKK